MLYYLNNGKHCDKVPGQPSITVIQMVVELQINLWHSVEKNIARVGV